jgi:8-oxo-dGTP diphosphatase
LFARSFTISSYYSPHIILFVQMWYLIAVLIQMWRLIADFFDTPVRKLVQFVANFLPVKVIRDDHGVPFLYRYHLFSLTKDGPGLCIHNFVKSDPDRGFHDHPWSNALSFILCGGYEERILDKNSPNNYVTKIRNPWTFNYLNGQNVFHRVMVNENKNAWTLFAFSKRSKTWGMVRLDGNYHAMSTSVTDLDGGWWQFVKKGLSIHQHLPLSGNVIATVDSVVIAKYDTYEKQKVLLIKRGKSPYKNHWAFPGGRIERSDTNLQHAAYRELNEETNLSSHDVELKLVKTVGDSTRDPRGFCISCVFYGEIFDENILNIKAGDDAIDYQWFCLDDLPDMAFDHKEILLSIIDSK